MNHFTPAQIAALRNEIGAAIRTTSGAEKRAILRDSHNADAIRKLLASANKTGWGETAAFIERIMP